MSTINLNHELSYFGSSHVEALSTQSLTWPIMQRLCVCLCFALIAFVSVLDMYFVEANPQIMAAEQNPICLALMKLEPASKIYFFVAKSFGLACVLLTLGGMFKVRYRYARTVLLSVTVFQIVLLSYLCLGDSRIGGCPNFALLIQDTPDSIFRLGD